VWSSTRLAFCVCWSSVCGKLQFKVVSTPYPIIHSDHCITCSQPHASTPSAIVTLSCTFRCLFHAVGGVLGSRLTSGGRSLNITLCLSQLHPQSLWRYIFAIKFCTLAPLPSVLHFSVFEMCGLMTTPVSRPAMETCYRCREAN
jgi:hypothetical protein